MPISELKYILPFAHYKSFMLKIVVKIKVKLVFAYERNYVTFLYLDLAYHTDDNFLLLHISHANFKTSFLVISN